ncbi:hypothetical protein [Halalkalicoccus jeotgali]|uniref:Uncharacterized protein n=1 Tax=Halalkalicoccus jeotgali (strain DSM 18796 / CECT 7217 / JCM 14584 / KCTC 4019 / B3) TaxID=795797 RepID=D8J5N1_HALJB|nr:hypothetical protein [Halalkalicoccus jeotgali]ADJ15727.1 hypothetical protein HacjB3_11720 [Halalkalicoccus jeotgali B3]ELY36503.1 hypothetical protein C497_10928 [Halalkalicoccus jeotgali B3]
MKPALDDIFLPCGWAVVALREDRIEFRRDDERLSLVAEPTDESPSMPELCTSQLWQLRCEQRVGEAKSGMRLDCVTTMDTAVETLLTYTQRINGIVEAESGISVGRVVELLDAEAPGNCRDRWNRDLSSGLGTHPPL